MKALHTLLCVVVAAGLVGFTATSADAGKPGRGGVHAGARGVKGGQRGYAPVHPGRVPQRSVRTTTSRPVRTVGYGINRVGSFGNRPPSHGPGLRLGGLAYGGFGGYGGYGFGGYGYGGLTAYSSGAVPVPPYYSLHPPVYYSAPVPRSYGYSPYAYPGWVSTPEAPVAVVQPATIENEFCPAALEKLEKKEKEQQEASDSFASKTQWIANPYASKAAKPLEPLPAIAAN